jgi:hypothetical protein
VATPIFSPPGGSYLAAQTVDLSDATPLATIYYTTNGTAPTTSSTQYTGSITVSSTETLEAIATASGYSQSLVASAVYTILPPPPAFTIAGTEVTVAPGATIGNTSTITVTPVSGFTGSVALTAAITSSPAGAQDQPALSFGNTTPVDITGSANGTATLTITTTGATTCALDYPKNPGAPWYVGGSATLACLMLVGVPSRRRSWRTMLGMLALLAALAGGVLACGGHGGSSNPGTTVGYYMITVTGASGSTTATGTVTLTVQ